MLVGLEFEPLQVPCCFIEQDTLYLHCSVLVSSRNIFEHDWNKRNCYFHNQTKYEKNDKL